MEQELIIAQHLVDFGCDVNIKDDVSIKLFIHMSCLISILCELKHKIMLQSKEKVKLILLYLYSIYWIIGV